MAFSSDVKMELLALTKVGIKVPVKAFEMASDANKMKEYENMRVRECADLLILLSQI